MNKWIADIFGNILTLGHILVIIAAFFAVTNGSVQIIQVVVFFIIYVLVVGTLAVFISINEKLGEIKDLLERSDR
jgi:ABC-type polysaccharide/polyol phosphate export permease